LADGYELPNFLTNPLVLDTDGDGLGRWLELEVTFTASLNADTDGNGRSDYADYYDPFHPTPAQTLMPTATN